MSVTRCPDCGGETRHEWTENIWNDAVKHIRTCGDCDLEYTVAYGRPRVIDIRRYDGEEP